MPQPSGLESSHLCGCHAEVAGDGGESVCCSQLVSNKGVAVLIAEQDP